MAHEFTFRRRVQFADTDMAGIVHFSKFFLYMEETEHAFLRSLGFSVHTKTPSGIVSFPRTAARCEYQTPLRFEDEVEIRLLVREKKDKSIVYDFVFLNVTFEPTVEVARGSMTVVCAARRDGENAMSAVSIPQELVAKIDVAPAYT